MDRCLKMTAQDDYKEVLMVELFNKQFIELSDAFSKVESGEYSSMRLYLLGTCHEKAINLLKASFMVGKDEK